MVNLYKTLYFEFKRSETETEDTSSDSGSEISADISNSGSEISTDISNSGSEISTDISNSFIQKRVKKKSKNLTGIEINNLKKLDIKEMPLLRQKIRSNR